MDILRFINSRDIREHLQKLNYIFSAPEAAFLVYQSRIATLAEKLNAWEEIIQTMPDCSMGKRINMMAIDSLHAFLREYISIQRKKLECFYRKENAVYSADAHYIDRQFGRHYMDRWQSDELFLEPDTCIAYFKENHLDERVVRARLYERSPCRFRHYQGRGRKA